MVVVVVEVAALFTTMVLLWSCWVIVVLGVQVVVQVVVVEAALVVALVVMVVVLVVEVVALFTTVVLLWSFWVIVVLLVEGMVRGVVLVVALEVAGAWLAGLFFKGNSCLFLSIEVVLLYDVSRGRFFPVCSTKSVTIFSMFFAVLSFLPVVFLVFARAILSCSSSRCSEVNLRRRDSFLTLSMMVQSASKLAVPISPSRSMETLLGRTRDAIKTARKNRTSILKEGGRG